MSRPVAARLGLAASIHALGLALGLALCLVSAATASAARRRVLVFPLTGSVPAELGRAMPELTKVIARSAGLAGAEVIVGTSTYDDAAALAGCSGMDSVCLGQVAAELGFAEVVVGSVAPGSDAGTITVTLTTFRDGEVATNTVTVAGSTLDVVQKALAREVAPLFVGKAEGSGPGEPPPPPDGPGDPVAPPPDPPPSPPPAPPASTTLERGGFARVHVAWWIVAGVGLASAATGAYFAADAASIQDDVDAAPTGSFAELTRLEALEDEGARKATLGGALLVGGGVALAAGAAMILYQGLAPASASDRETRIGVVPLRGGGALTFEVSLP